MRQRFEAILVFYKPYFLWSIGITILMIVLNTHMVPILFMKFILTVFLYYILQETSGKQKFIFYKNLGISNLRLFSTLFLIDIFITLPLIWMLREFI